jgi:ADP-dependent NAD(P)H-hydrate dehydratase / NAD(P)H-hydrate epimerase
MLNNSNPLYQTLDLKTLKEKLLPPRKRTAHKGDFGHVLIVGGDFGMAGAARMSAEAAARAGAGLVSVATRPEHIAAINTVRPELMCHGVEDSSKLEKLLERADVIVAGPGLGQSEWSKKLWNKTLDYAKTSAKPLVLDADALNIVASDKLSAEAIANKETLNANWILTPHPKEAARLLGSTVDIVQNDRGTALQALVKRYKCVCVLKGAGTLIAKPTGNTTDAIIATEIAMCQAGNPGMASGGMGDILSGILGGLLAQGISAFDAASLGVCLHATAGDMAAAAQGERGLLALDLLPYVQKLVN